MNEFKGKKGYTDIIQLPVPGAQPQRYALDILESFENICYARAYNNGNTHSEYHIYLINEGSEPVRVRESIYYDKDNMGNETIQRFSGRPDEVKALYDSCVNKRKVNNTAIIAKIEADKTQAEAKKIEATAISKRALKQAECNTAKYKAVGELKQLLLECKDIHSLLKDKVASKLINDITAYDLITKYIA